MTSINCCNNCYSSIEFIHEVGSKVLNFFDLTISIAHNIHEFIIFRKPTATVVLIQGDSFSPVPHKFAAFHATIPVTLDVIDGKGRRGVVLADFLNSGWGIERGGAFF